jgi:hypothetical protein
MQYRACQGDFCDGKIYPVGTEEDWLGRWKLKKGEGVVVYTEDPFLAEIRDEIVMLWLCEYCWYGSHDQI